MYGTLFPPPTSPPRFSLSSSIFHSDADAAAAAAAAAPSVPAVVKDCRWKTIRSAAKLARGSSRRGLNVVAVLLRPILLSASMTIRGRLSC